MSAQVEEYFSDVPVLTHVAWCESNLRHADSKGAVFRGVVNDRDVGVMQINEDFHLARSQKLGFDIYTLQGNMAYARYLYGKEGTTPWSSSRKCWKERAEKTSPLNLALVGGEKKN